MDEYVKFFNADEFDLVHAQICDHGNQWNSIGENVAECELCRARVREAGTEFWPDANPQYDSDGRKTGSGAYVEVEFCATIPMEDIPTELNLEDFDVETTEWGL